MRNPVSPIICLLFSAVLAAPVLASTTAAPKPAPKVAVAPADEYFGRQKVSTLGIDNMIRDTTTREGFNPQLANRLYTPLMAAEDALEDWARKYPGDTWIPKRAYLLSHLFWRMNTPDADKAAERCRSVLFTHFPKNKYAVMAHKEIKSTWLASIAPPSPAPIAMPPVPATPAPAGH